MSRMVQAHSFANFTKKCQKTKYKLTKKCKSVMRKNKLGALDNYFDKT